MAAAVVLSSSRERVAIRSFRLFSSKASLLPFSSFARFNVDSNRNDIFKQAIGMGQGEGGRKEVL